jgi:membrane associated rhomboid family serine protease
MTHDQQSALSVGATAVYAILTAVLTRPINLAIVTGALSTIVTAAGVFGFHVSADAMSVFNTALVALATLLLTNLVSPHPAIDPRVP